MFYYYKLRFILLLNNILLNEILYLLYAYNLRYKYTDYNHITISMFDTKKAILKDKKQTL